MPEVRALTEEERARLKEALEQLSEVEKAELYREAMARVEEGPQCPLCGRLFVNVHALNVPRRA